MKFSHRFRESDLVEETRIILVFFYLISKISSTFKCQIQQFIKIFKDWLIFIPQNATLIIQWNLFCVRWSWDLNIQHCIAYLTLIQELGEYRGAGMLESDVSYYCNIGIIPIVDYNCFSLTLSSFPYMVISKISINNRNVNTYVSVEGK